MKNGIPLSSGEIAVVSTCGGAASKDCLAKRIGSWNLGNSGLMLCKLDTSAESCYDWTKETIIFLFPQDGEKFINFLSEISLNYNLTMATNYDFMNKLYVEGSRDGTTNIDADVLEMFIQAMKRKA